MVNTDIEQKAQELAKEYTAAKNWIKKRSSEIRIDGAYTSIWRHNRESIILQYSPPITRVTMTIYRPDRFQDSIDFHNSIVVDFSGSKRIINDYGRRSATEFAQSLREMNLEHPNSVTANKFARKKIEIQYKPPPTMPALILMPQMKFKLTLQNGESRIMTGKEIINVYNTELYNRIKHASLRGETIREKPVNKIYDAIRRIYASNPNIKIEQLSKSTR